MYPVEDLKKVSSAFMSLKATDI